MTLSFAKTSRQAMGPSRLVDAAIRIWRSARSSFSPRPRKPSNAFRRRLRRACRQTSALALDDLRVTQSQSGGLPFVAMVEPADFWSRHDAAGADRVDPAGLGCVFAERKVRSGTVVVRQIGAKDAPKVSLVEHDHVVQRPRTPASTTPHGSEAHPRVGSRRPSPGRAVGSRRRPAGDRRAIATGGSSTTRSRGDATPQRWPVGRRPRPTSNPAMRLAAQSRTADRANACGLRPGAPIESQLLPQCQVLESQTAVLAREDDQEPNHADDPGDHCFSIDAD